MRKKLVFFLLVLVFALAIFLRFYKLGGIPPSLDWDEASLGYNAYTILRTGRDEYGNFLPISIRSFNDYKASVYVYFSTLPIVFFGLSEFSIRFVSAFFGSLTVLVTFFLIRELVSLDKGVKEKESLALLTSFLLSVSPWHLQFSRVAFEANLALFFFVAGGLFLLLSFRKNIFFPLTAVFYGLSVFSYHSTKIVMPVFVLGILLLFGKKVFREKKYILISGFISFLLIAFFLYSLKLGAASRLGSTSVFLEDRNVLATGKQIIANYFSHFDFNFLFVKGDQQLRHHSLDIGQLYLWELPFVIAGIVFLIKNKFRGKGFIFWWFLTAPLASSLTKDTPNAVRSLLFLPTFQLFTAYGILSLYQSIRKDILKFSFLAFSFSLFALSFFYYLHIYFVHYPLESSQSWLYGYKQAVEFVNSRKDRYEKIIVTTAYDQPYIYFLFYQKPLKVLFNSGEFCKGFEKLEFRKINWKNDQRLRNSLLIGTKEELPENENIVKEIKFLDGEIAFKIANSF